MSGQMLAVCTAVAVVAVAVYSPWWCLVVVTSTAMFVLGLVSTLLLVAYSGSRVSTVLADTSKAQLPAKFLRAGIALRSKQLLQRKSTAISGRPPPNVDHRSTAVQEELQQILLLLTRDYLDYWYKPLSENDPLLGDAVRDALWAIIDSLQQRLVAADLMKLLTRDLVILLTSHFQSVRQVPDNQFPSHPCLISQETEQRYLERAAAAMLRLFLPMSVCPSGTVREVLKEILARSVLQTVAESWCEPDFINSYLLYHCDRAAEATHKSKASYAYSKTYAAFVKMIASSDDIEALSQIRYHIITEIMQAKLIKELKAEAKAGNEAALASLTETAKGVHLQGRNLVRYINQCVNCKQLCEKQIVMLGGPDYRDSSADVASQGPSSTGRKDGTVLSLPEIIEDGLALGYFLQFLQLSGRASGNLQFWLACESLKKEVMGGEPISKGRIMNIREICKAPVKAESSRIKVTGPTMERMMMAARRLGAEPPDIGQDEMPEMDEIIKPTPQDLSCFYTAQTEVYEYIESQFYRRFLMHELYRDYVRHSGRALQRERESDRISLSSYSEEDAPESPVTPSRASPSKRLLLPLEEEELEEEEEEEEPHSPVYKDMDIERRQEEISLQIKDEMLQTELRGESTDGVLKELQSLEDKMYELRHYLERTQEWISNSGNWRVDVQSAEDVSVGGKDQTVYALTVHASTEGEARSGWIVTRRIDEFIKLHKNLRGCADNMPKNLPVPKKRWFSGSDQGEKTRAALQQYLAMVLMDDVLCQSEDLYAFLCPSSEHLRRQQLTEDIRSKDTGKGEADAREEEETMDSIAEPLYLLVSELFELKGLFSWFRRQIVAFVQLTYGTTINRNLKETIDWLRSESQILFYLTVPHAQFRCLIINKSFKATMFPDDWEAPPAKTDEEKVQTQQEARTKMLENLPAILQSLVGQGNCKRGALRVFGNLQNKHMNKHLFYMLFEAILVTLGSPELRQRDLKKVLVPLNASEEWLGEYGSARD